MKTEHAADNAQEWTEDQIISIAGIDCISVEDANAALAAERERVQAKLDEAAEQSVALVGHVILVEQLREQLSAAQAAIADLLNTSTEIGTGVVSEAHVKARINAINMDTTALDAAIEQKRLEIWRDAPNQPDIQEAVIARLDLVHRHAVATATKPLVDALKSYEYDSNGHIVTWLSEAAHRDALAKVKEGK